MKDLSYSNVFMLHWCPTRDLGKEQHPDTRTYDKHWIPRIEKELKTKGIEVFRPLMPRPRERVYATFEQEFKKYDIYQRSVGVNWS